MKDDHYGDENDVSSKAPNWWPGVVAVLVMALIAIIAVFSMGCGTEYPVAISVRGDYGRVTYSSKGGIEIEVEK